MRKRSPLVLIIMMAAPVVMAIGNETPTPQPLVPPPAPALPTQSVLPTPFAPVLTPIPRNEGFAQELAAARAALAQGNTEEALTVLNAVLTVDRFFVPALELRAQAYMRAARYPSAIADYDNIIRQQRWRLEMYTLRAQAHIRNNDIDAAIADLTRLITLFPYDSESFYLRGDLYAQRGQADLANLDYEFGDALYSADIAQWQIIANNARRLNPQLAGYALTEVASAYVNSGQVEEALRFFDEALALAPGFNGAYLSRGLLYEQLGNKVQAGFDFLVRIQNLQLALAERNITIGTPLPLEMHYGRVFLLRFRAGGGDVLTFRVQGSNNDPLMVLLDSEGQPIAGSDDSEFGLDSYLPRLTMPYSGNYTLVVSHAGAGWTGTMTASIVQEMPAPQTTPTPG
jgi:Flp pilus assembly protein TadD